MEASEPSPGDASGAAERGDGPPRVVDGPVDLDALLRATEDAACGGLAVFCGTVRDENRGRPVEGLGYEAHLPVAERVLAEIEAEVTERCGARRCRIQHRVGELDLGEISVAVVVRASHRDAAFAGARYAIDELKERVPVWKEEHYADGERRHLEGTPLRDGPGAADGAEGA